MTNRNSFPKILLLVILFSSIVVNVYLYVNLVNLRGDIAEIKTSYEELNEEYINCARAKIYVSRMPRCRL